MTKNEKIIVKNAIAILKNLLNNDNNIEDPTEYIMNYFSGGKTRAPRVSFKTQLAKLTAHVEGPSNGVAFVKYNGMAKRDAYKYIYNEFAKNHEQRKDTLQERLNHWMKVNNVDAAGMVKYLNGFAGRYGNFKFNQQSIQGYMLGKYCPKVDRMIIMARAMSVSPAWLAGYGPREMR